MWHSELQAQRGAKNTGEAERKEIKKKKKLEKENKGKYLPCPNK